MLEIYGRYGHVGDFANDDPTLAVVFKHLIGELCTEQFPQPDIEHESVWATDSAGWSLLAKMSGLVSWSNVNSPSSQRHRRDIPVDELQRTFLMLAAGRVVEIDLAGWVPREELPPFRRNFYLYLNRPLKSELHKAAHLNDVAWASTLIQGGAKLEAKDDDGATPLHCAALANRLDMCRLLIDAGADVNPQDINGETPLAYARESSEIMRLLLANGAR